MKTIERFVRKVLTTRPPEPVAAVARSMQQHNVGALVVLENDKPVGMVTDRDIAVRVVAAGRSPQSPVGSIMSTPIRTVYQDDGVLDTTEAMMEAKVRRLPVIDDDGRLVGIVALDDLLRVLSRELSNVIEGIRPEMETR